MPLFKFSTGTLCSLFALLLLSSQQTAAGQTAPQAASPQPPPDRWNFIGDSPDNPPPLATDLSANLKVKDVDRAMRKVANWQLQRVQGHFNEDWTFAAMDAGFMVASKSLKEPSYENYVRAVGENFQWRLGPRQTHADDQAIGQSYLEIYMGLKTHDARIITPLRQQFDQVMTLPDDPAKPFWWWCDALFMAPPVWARLYQATGEKRYLDYMDHEWWITSKLLYDPAEHLYFRDATYFDKREKNGAKIFWSRGNGWVMAGLARVLAAMPQDYPDRSKFVQQFKEMSARVIQLQQTDGLWRPGLLDPGAYPLPEVSGSAFLVYALAWGVNHGILDRTTYMPAIEKGWKGLIAHIYADGRLGCIQPVGAAPGAFQADSSYVYGVGAFLLAGSEVRSLHVRN
ncbi:glycoside hydrolase family 105 protein [Acidicapsa dinghuensis]|uniref:Glycoside hydrolase family 105 protein n=1 Tax=Acidicapsa dinghuensis TaxID=2218256 RepID=A0ABW1ELD8_9BACT|nr:glycoside hydrolase family 88 protein [Acidicapsa dinghuensis]